MAELPDLTNPSVFREELKPVAEKLLNRHMATTKEWFPHEFVPYSMGETFEKGYEWKEEDSGIILPKAVRSALFVNLLTEDNLPYYYNDLEYMFGKEDVFGTWNRRWTAEEGRHSMVIRDYLIATRAVDPRALERARMAQVSGGETPHPPSPLVGAIYVSFQELATRVAHRNTGKMVNDSHGYEVMSRVANDENLHYLFYKDLVSAAIEINPSQTVSAMREVVRKFKMPGTGITDFESHSERIALSGIYGVTELHKVMTDVVYDQWKVNKLEGLTPAAESARKLIEFRIGILAALANEEAVAREEYQASLAN